MAVPVAPLNGEPRVSAAQVSQYTRGADLVVIERSDDWLRVRGEDGYEGWMHRGYIAESAGAGDPTSGGSADRSVFSRLSLGCAVRTSSGRAMQLPFGARVRDDDVVENGRAVERAECERMFPRDPAAVARTAVEAFAGTSYQWGGVTPWGADCSGLVQTAFGVHGIRLPRDAWQQAEAAGGAELADPGALAPGDLLFFSDRPDRRITHVGIAAGGTSMVHLALGRGGYAVDRLDDRSDAYVAKLVERFLFARRVLP